MFKMNKILGRTIVTFSLALELAYAELSIENITLSDCDEIVSFTKMCWQESYKDILDQAVLDNFPEHSFLEGRTFILSQENCSCVKILDEGGRIIGFSDAGKSWQSEEKDLEGEVFSIYIASNHQKKGLGQLLFYFQKDFLISNGFKTMIIWTLENNVKGRSFYEKMNGQYVKSQLKNIFGKEYISVMYQWELTK